MMSRFDDSDQAYSRRVGLIEWDNLIEVPASWAPSNILRIGDLVAYAALGDPTVGNTAVTRLHFVTDIWSGDEGIRIVLRSPKLSPGRYVDALDPEGMQVWMGSPELLGARIYGVWPSTPAGIQLLVRGQFWQTIAAYWAGWFPRPMPGPVRRQLVSAMMADELPRWLGVLGLERYLDQVPYRPVVPNATHLILWPNRGQVYQQHNAAVLLVPTVPRLEVIIHDEVHLDDQMGRVPKSDLEHLSAAIAPF